jgi:hypothetical protein
MKTGLGMELSGRALAQHVQSLGFNSQYYIKNRQFYDKNLQTPFF